MSNLNTIRRKWAFLTFRDVWYDSSKSYCDADVIYLMQMDKSFGNDYYDQYTILTDLEEDADKIYAHFSKSCREKISSASKADDIEYLFHKKPDLNLLNKFTSTYNKFAKKKKIAKVEYDRMLAYLDNDLLVFSSIVDKKQKTLVWHVYRYNQDRVYLIYTVSVWFDYIETSMKNKIGKLNRYAHWMDMLRFKELGVKYYDFGGWYNGNKDEEKLRINLFKEEFGGAVTENYNSILYITIKGKAFKLLKKFKEYFK